MEVFDFGDVRLDAHRGLAEGGQLLLQPISGLLVGDVVDDDLGALRRQGHDNSLTDAGIASGDNGNLALELLGHEGASFCASARRRAMVRTLSTRAWWCGPVTCTSPCATKPLVRGGLSL